MQRLVSVQQDWCVRLPVQQQSVLLLATRGPDGAGKFHPGKPVVQAYRAMVLVAGRYGRPLEWGERGDSFMTMHVIADDLLWESCVDRWLANVDDLPHHYLLHFLYGAEICGYKASRRAAALEVGRLLPPRVRGDARQR